MGNGIACSLLQSVRGAAPVPVGHGSGDGALIMAECSPAWYPKAIYGCGLPGRCSTEIERSLMRNVLLQLHIGTPIDCKSWSNIPVAHGLQLTVYTEASSGPPAQIARHLYAMIRRQLMTVGGWERDAPCQINDGAIFPAHTCAGAVEGLANRVLVYIADGTARMEPIFESYFGSGQARIVPVVDSSLGCDVPTALPSWMNTTIAVETRGADPAPILPKVIRSAGLLSQTPSVFVSYVHDDARDVAGQLFHELSARGYAVFLDRFSGRPGDDFVDLIAEELANKACLLALETPNYRTSPWCAQEVATAIVRKMGMIAIDLPGSRRSFPEFAHRHDARRAVLQSSRLSKADLAAACDAFERWFPHQISRRPRHLDRSLRSALRAAGLSFSDVGLGRCRTALGGAPRLLAMCPTSPDVDDFRDVDALRTGTREAASLFGSVAAARSSRRARID